MSDGPSTTYDRPPIVEVVAAVAFKRLVGLDSIRLSRFWDREMSAGFPVVQQQPPYAVPIERFGPDAQIPSLSFEFDQNYPTPRLWFASEAGDELLQLQTDWFACNWRKVKPEAAYSRWPTRQREFETWFSKLQTFVESESIGQIVPTQCEVTYINHITPNQVWSNHGELDQILRIVGDNSLEPLQRDQSALMQSYIIPDDLSGQPVGRLHLSIRPAFANNDQTPIFALELTARGFPDSPDIGGVLKFLAKARGIIVRTFDVITTPEIQREWGRHVDDV